MTFTFHFNKWWLAVLLTLIANLYAFTLRNRSLWDFIPTATIMMILGGTIALWIGLLIGSFL